MRLSETQRRILYALTLNANAAISDIARMLDLRDHIVRRAVELFFESKVFLRRSTWVNPFQLGLDHHVVHLELPLQSIQARDLFLKLLGDVEETGAVVELGAEAQFELRLITRGPSHLSQFFERLSDSFPHPFKVLRCLTTLELEYSGPSEAGLSHLWRPLRVGPIASQPHPQQLDETDHRVLSALANLNYLNLKQLSRLVDIPPTTLQYRVARLEASGVISGHFYVMDPKVFNDIPVAIQVRSRAFTQREKDQLKRFAHHHCRIAWVSFFLGEQSAEVYTLVSGFEEAQRVISDLSKEFGSVIDSVHMTPQLSFSKYSTYPYLNYSTLTGEAHTQ